MNEKNLLEMINACVSHEMRNPINSILCQSLKLADFAQILTQLAMGKAKSVEQIQHQLKIISQEMKDSCDV